MLIVCGWAAGGSWAEAGSGACPLPLLLWLPPWLCDSPLWPLLCLSRRTSVSLILWAPRRETGPIRGLGWAGGCLELLRWMGHQDTCVPETEGSWASRSTNSHCKCHLVFLPNDLRVSRIPRKQNPSNSLLSLTGAPCEAHCAPRPPFAKVGTTSSCVISFFTDFVK